MAAFVGACLACRHVEISNLAVACMSAYTDMLLLPKIVQFHVPIRAHAHLACPAVQFEGGLGIFWIYAFDS